MIEPRTCQRRQRAKTNDDGLVGGFGTRGALLPGLRERRVQATLSQKELAEKAGIHQSAVSALENCRRAAFPKTIRRLCAALEASPAQLLTAEASEEE